MSFVSDVVGGTIEGYARRQERLTDQDIKTQSLAMEREKFDMMKEEYKRRIEEEKRNNTPILLDNVWSAMKLTRNQKMIAEQFANMTGRVDTNTRTMRQGDVLEVGKMLMEEPVLFKTLAKLGMDDSSKDLKLKRDQAQAYIDKKYPKGYTIEMLMDSDEMQKNEELAKLLGEVSNYSGINKYHTEMYHAMSDKEREKEKISMDMSEFEQVRGIDPSKRGTPEYEQEYTKYLENKEDAKRGSSHFIGTNPDGQAVLYNYRTSEFKTKDLPGGKLNPKQQVLLPAEQQSKLAEFDTILSVAENIKNKFDPSYVGPIKGRTGRLQEKYTNQLPEEQLEFYTDVSALKNELLRLRSGATITDQEYQRLLNEMPNQELTSKTFMVRTERFIRILNQTLENKRREFGEIGYRVGKSPKETTKQRKPLESFEGR